MAVIHGSTSLATTTAGSWRTKPTANLTDRGFTGHLHHNLGRGAEDIGLVYMAARWYAPALGRFLSADTLIPDPANPQSYNRYSYVQNRPLVFTDPTGHRPSDGCETESCSLAEGLDPNNTWQTSDGTQLPWNPVQADAQNYNPVTAAALPAAASLAGVATLPTVGGYIASDIAWPALVKAGSTIASWLCLDGDCGNEGRMLLNNVSKGDAREAIRSGIESLSQGQMQKVLDILKKGRIDNFSMQLFDGNELQVTVERAGMDGFQRLIYTLDPSGKTIGLIQEAYNSLGEMVHYHNKMP